MVPTVPADRLKTPYCCVVQYPWDIVKKAWELGLMNVTVPQEYGQYYPHIPVVICKVKPMCTINMFVLLCVLSFILLAVQCFILTALHPILVCVVCCRWAGSEDDR